MSCTPTLRSSDSSSDGSLHFLDSDDDDEYYNAFVDQESCPVVEVDPMVVDIEAQQEEESLHLSALSLEYDYDHNDDDNDADDQSSHSGAAAVQYANDLSMPSLGTSIRTSSSTRTVQLVSPATWPAGYQFVARVADGKEYLVEVFQPNGVQCGQVFQAMIVREHIPHNDNASGTSRRHVLRAQPGHFIPYGYWRDGLFDCFRFGLAHSVVWLACCCSPLVLAQVMTRLDLNLWGQKQPSPPNEADIAMTAKNKWVDDSMSQCNLHDSEHDSEHDNHRNDKPEPWTPFRTMSTLLLVHFVVMETILSAVAMSQIHARQEGRISVVPTRTYVLLGMRAASRTALLFYIWTVATRTRTAVRQRYGIPEQSCDVGMEDAVVSVVCLPCSAAQMARHTADYETYDATCCTATGLSAFAPPSV